MHISAVIFLLIATALYAASLLPGAAAFAVLGLFFELMAWVLWFAHREKDEKNGSVDTGH